MTQSLPASLDAWLDYISAQHPSTVALGLARVREVWARMSGSEQPPQAPINILVGGTNGKGSTCAMLERILHCAGYKVGCYTSPHLLHYRERVRVGLGYVSDEVHCAAFAAVETARGETPLTYFEFGTLAALRIFADSKLDVAVMEIGLGGRLDAVNLIDADCAIVVSVDLDHIEILGPDREAIGFEKAGIFRAQKPAIYGELNPPQSLLDHAAAISADLQILGRDFGFSRMDQQWQFQGRRGKRHALPIPALRGPYQLANASVCLAALDELQDRLPITQGDVRRGLLEVELAGRLQVLPGQPVIVLDVAHNPHAARVLEDALATMGYFESTRAVFAMLKDKDINGVISTVRHRMDHWHVAGLGGERGISAADLVDKLAAQGVEAGSVSAHVSVASALAAARAAAGRNDRILVFGSFHTVAEALSALGMQP